MYINNCKCGGEVEKGTGRYYVYVRCVKCKRYSSGSTFENVISRWNKKNPKKRTEPEAEADSKTGTCVVCGVEDTSIRRRFGWCTACEKRYFDYIRTDNTRQETNNNMLTHEKLTAFNLLADKVNLAVPRLIERLNNHEKLKKQPKLQFDLGSGLFVKYCAQNSEYFWDLYFENECLLHLDSPNRQLRSKTRIYLILSDILQRLDSGDHETLYVESDTEDFEIRR